MNPVDAFCRCCAVRGPCQCYLLTARRPPLWHCAESSLATMFNGLDCPSFHTRRNSGLAPISRPDASFDVPECDTLDPLCTHVLRWIDMHRDIGDPKARGYIMLSLSQLILTVGPPAADFVPRRLYVRWQSELVAYDLHLSSLYKRSTSGCRDVPF
jgi:hypothetical protein